MSAQTAHPVWARIDLRNLTHNVRLLQRQAGGVPLWPAIKANAYGHDALLVARHLLTLGIDTLCVARVEEALGLVEAGVQARLLVLSGATAEHARECVRHALEPVVAQVQTLEALQQAAAIAGRRIDVHLKVDTGMMRFGMAPEAVGVMLERCSRLPNLRVRSLMSHFACADEADKRSAREQLQCFTRVRAIGMAHGVPLYHMANSAALLDLPEALFDAARPGIAIYGLKPSDQLHNPIAEQLRPVLSLHSLVSLVKTVPAGVGISYGHAFHTSTATRVATLPVGYGDGIARGLSGRLEVLIGGRRCPQIGRITMDQMLVDVSALWDTVRVGDEAVLIGSQPSAESSSAGSSTTIRADELAALGGTINYEIVTAIAARVPRVAG
ncbi:MAG: alanine racemase [Gammaproteobacteria bacterium]|nr:alanine racemase [Gammaproteobacteria bacterium]